MLCGFGWQLQAAEPAAMGDHVAPVAEAQGSDAQVAVDQRLLDLADLGIVVATIESVRLEPLQQKGSEPLPTAHLNISEQLRGESADIVRFVPLLYGSDAYSALSDEQRMQWKGMDLGSMTGKRWILITNASSVIAAYPFSDARVQTVRQQMAVDDGFAGPLLLFLALMTVGLAVLNWLLAMPPAGSLLMLLLQLICFGIYEYGVPPASSDRIDLLFLIPAILFNLWLTYRRCTRPVRRINVDGAG